MIVWRWLERVIYEENADADSSAFPVQIYPRPGTILDCLHFHRGCPTDYHAMERSAPLP